MFWFICERKKLPRILADSCKLQIYSLVFLRPQFYSFSKNGEISSKFVLIKRGKQSVEEFGNGRKKNTHSFLFFFLQAKSFCSTRSQILSFHFCFAFPQFLSFFGFPINLRNNSFQSKKKKNFLARDKLLARKNFLEFGQIIFKNM